ncbi:MAG: ABC transporter permease [Chthonomonas sp.]|nr:ABC transporter permease [Chthonomonas sp.]
MTRWLARFSALYLILLAIFAVVVPMMRPFDRQAGGVNLPPGGAFPLGTDQAGYDILARLAYGARISLGVGLTVQAIALLLGVTLGILAVFGPKWVQIVILRITDTMFAFPDILLAILIIGIWGDTSIRPVIIALSITAWPSIVRLVKTQAATLKDREFVLASDALGAKKFYTVTRHIIPHLWGSLLAVLMVEIAGTILAESALSFLGIGVQPPTPSWGSMISDANQQKASNPVMLIWPCLILSLTIFALNFLGDGLQAKFDPQRKEN